MQQNKQNSNLEVGTPKQSIPKYYIPKFRSEFKISEFLNLYQI